MRIIESNLENASSKSIADIALLQDLCVNQKILCTWENISENDLSKVADFLDHFDTAIKVSESSIDFILPLIALKPFMQNAKKHGTKIKNYLQVCARY